MFQVLTTVAVAQEQEEAVAQEQEEAVAQEKFKTPLVIHDLKLGINLLLAGRTLIGSGKDTQETSLTLGINQWNLAFDYGVEENHRTGNYTYKNKGSFFRVGIDRNFVHKIENGNVLSFGARYASADFKDELNYILNNGYGEQPLHLSNPTLNARWLELTANLRGRVISNLYMGFTLRWQFARQVKGEGELKTFDIPGFGNTKKQNSTGFDYYVMWRIPLEKKTNEP